MDTELRDAFIRSWEAHFEGSELPITFGIGIDTGKVKKAPVPKGWRCLICDLTRIRNGIPLAFDNESLTCAGAKFYLGYTAERAPEFRYFLSYGKPGVVEGERYKRTPEIVDEATRHSIRIPAQGRCYTFKRWDQLTADDSPEVVIFFARPEVLSGLFTLANFDETDPNGGVFCPFGAGCGSIIYHPWLEQQKENPRAVLGMFDPSSRPCVPSDVLTMAIPMKKFVKMVGYMEESFLITPAWKKVMRKIKRSREIHAG